MSSVEEHRAAGQECLGFAVLTVSDSRSLEDDASGASVSELVEGAGHRLAQRRLVRDEIQEIEAAVLGFLIQPEVDLVVVTGGSGLAPRDVTPEAVEPLFERRIEGFGELFRLLSFRKVGPAAMLSRASAGVREGKAIFVLPGSPDAVEAALRELILPEAGHLLSQLRAGLPLGVTMPAP